MDYLSKSTGKDMPEGAMSDRTCIECKTCRHWLADIADPGCELAERVAKISNGECDHYEPNSRPKGPFDWLWWKLTQKGRKGGDE